MKQNHWILVSVLGLGVALGWLMKPAGGPTRDEQTVTTNTRPRSSDPARAVATTEDESPTRTRAGERPADLPKVQTFTASEGGELPAHAKEMIARMEQQKKESRARKVDERLAVLKARLNLTPEQETTVRALLEKAGASPGVGSISIGGPGGGMVISEGDSANAKEVEKQIAGLLSPEQQEDYAAFQNEQEENRSEIATNREMMRLQEQLTLTPEQKDRVFEKLGDLVRKEQADPAGNGMSPEVREAAKQARVDALEPILTPEQLEILKANPQPLSMGTGFGFISEGAVIGVSASSVSGPNQPAK